MPLPIAEVLADLPDPRRETDNKLHRLVDILALAVCAVIGGAETWDAIAEYGRSKGPSSAASWRRPMASPAPTRSAGCSPSSTPPAFADRFGRWMAQASSAAGLTPVAVDGKSSRAARKATATGCLHTASAFAVRTRRCGSSRRNESEPWRLGNRQSDDSPAHPP